jgi:hypothetical protein
LIARVFSHLFKETEHKGRFSPDLHAVIDATGVDCPLAAENIQSVLVRACSGKRLLQKQGLCFAPVFWGEQPPPAIFIVDVLALPCSLA